VPKRVILEADFDRGMIEYVPEDSFARCAVEEAPARRCGSAAEGFADDRVKGLVARVGEGV
jgi:hypothetical protein